jgi:hypothetical protein
LPYALKDGDEYRFQNSDLIVRYLDAVRALPLPGANQPAEWQIINRLFTENSPRKILWQEDFNNYYDDAAAREILNSWLNEFGYSTDDVVKITTLVDSSGIAEKILENRRIVEDQIKIVKIPTMIFGGSRHDGIYKAN